MQKIKLLPISFANEYNKEYDEIIQIKDNGENVSKFVCEAIRFYIKYKTGEIEIPKQENNITINDLSYIETKFEKKILELEKLIKEKNNNSETKIIYKSLPENENQNIEVIDNDLKQIAGVFEF